MLVMDTGPQSRLFLKYEGSVLVPPSILSRIFIGDVQATFGALKKCYGPKVQRTRPFCFVTGKSTENTVCLSIPGPSLVAGQNDAVSDRHAVIKRYLGGRG